MNGFQFTLQILSSAVAILLPLLVLRIFLQVHRKTHDNAFLWLAAGIAGFPMLHAIGGAVASQLFSTFGTAGHLIWNFMNLTLSCASIGCTAISLGLVERGCVPLRRLFSRTEDPGTREGEV